MLPNFDYRTHHHIIIKTTPATAYEALHQVDFSRSFLIRSLFKVRGIKSRNFQNLLEGFTILLDKPPHELVLGVIGRPWHVTEGFLETEDFQNFNEPGWAKVTWSFACEKIEDKTLVSTETRIKCTDATSRKKFGIYWFFVRPFSSLVRKEMLRLLRNQLEN